MLLYMMLKMFLLLLSDAVDDHDDDDASCSNLLNQRSASRKEIKSSNVRKRRMDRRERSVNMM